MRGNCSFTIKERKESGTLTFYIIWHVSMIYPSRLSTNKCIKEETHVTYRNGAETVIWFSRICIMFGISKSMVRFLSRNLNIDIKVYRIK